MRVAVVGGTGLVGRHTVAALQRDGHDAVVVARSTGVDVTTGAGLDEALHGVEAVVDVTNSPATDRDEAVAFFSAATEHLLAAEERAGVSHHVPLSIVGLDRVEGNAHYAGKRRQEELVTAGPSPFTIVRATQFYEFAEMVVSWSTRDDEAAIAPLLVQPLAVADVGQTLAEIAIGPAQGHTVEVAGPEPQDFFAMAQRVVAIRGGKPKLRPSWRGIFGVRMAGEVLLPGPDARLSKTTFDDWLERESASSQR
jgi:uncharacterized protein YbjT (DUF2867 family)